MTLILMEVVIMGILGRLLIKSFFLAVIIFSCNVKEQQWVLESNASVDLRKRYVEYNGEKYTGYSTSSVTIPTASQNRTLRIANGPNIDGDTSLLSYGFGQTVKAIDGVSSEWFIGEYVAGAGNIPTSIADSPNVKRTASFPK